MRLTHSKTGYFLLEGLNSFATAYYFNYLLFLLRDVHGFSNLDNLAVAAVHGLVYIPASIFGGRFGQRRGNFKALRIGFGGMTLGIALGWFFPSILGQFAALGIWTVSLCFTWPMLEALVSADEAPEQLPNRVGLYNVIWAGTAALGYSSGGWIFGRLGAGSLYWLPIVIHLVQFIATWPLERRHRMFRALRGEAVLPQETTPVAGGSDHFQRLAWLANPFNYMAINTVVAMAPGLSARMGLDLAGAGLVFSLWFYARALAFLKLWLWPGWHYRFGWFLGAFVTLAISFAAMVVTHSMPVLLVAQLGLGWSSALLYYSSLYYAMDGSSSHSEHGGIHEALIGVGVCGGPAVSAAAQFVTGSLSAPAWVVAGLLAAAVAVSVRIHHRARRPR